MSFFFFLITFFRIFVVCFWGCLLVRMLNILLARFDVFFLNWGFIDEGFFFFWYLAIIFLILVVILLIRILLIFIFSWLDTTFDVSLFFFVLSFDFWLDFFDDLKFLFIVFGLFSIVFVFDFKVFWNLSLLSYLRFVSWFYSNFLFSFLFLVSDIKDFLLILRLFLSVFLFFEVLIDDLWLRWIGKLFWIFCKFFCRRE